MLFTLCHPVLSRSPYALDRQAASANQKSPAALSSQSERVFLAASRTRDHFLVEVRASKRVPSMRVLGLQNVGQRRRQTSRSCARATQRTGQCEHGGEYHKTPYFDTAREWWLVVLDKWDLGSWGSCRLLIGQLERGTANQWEPVSSPGECWLDTLVQSRRQANGCWGGSSVIGPELVSRRNYGDVLWWDGKWRRFGDGSNFKFLCEDHGTTIVHTARISEV